ncbi:MAG: hypothetical protein K0R90_978 [Oscillospiraceae bacterium]|jgi:hypothetical protein|nr:hypothetical protein [Oscillospiraceae bacterium]
MKPKMILATALTVGLLATGGTQAFAATASQGSTNSSQATTSQSKTDSNSENKRPELTEEQKAKFKEMQERMQAAKQKWDSLSDTQKAKIYSLNEKMNELKKQMADEYAKLGIIDNDTASKFKERITDNQSKIKDSGKMPMIGSHKHGHGAKS